MCDENAIGRMFACVMQEDILKYHLTSSDIRVGIQNMKEVYKPNPTSLSSDSIDVANYNDAAHRCAYLHKYAPFHTALVSELLLRAVQEKNEVFRSLLLNSGTLNLCSLGGGPGSDVIGTIAVLNAVFGFFQTSATIVDYMSGWRDTFDSLIQELRYGMYGPLSECVGHQYFVWSYLGSNLLSKMTNQVNKAIQAANLVTMVKFVSAAACKETPAMLQKIFRSMRPGSLVLYIDNAGGGFHQLVRREAVSCGLFTVFGPLKHYNYINQSFHVKRFGYTPCLETKVTAHMWQKSAQTQLRNCLDNHYISQLGDGNSLQSNRELTRQVPKKNRKSLQTISGSSISVNQNTSRNAQTHCIPPHVSEPVLELESEKKVILKGYSNVPGREMKPTAFSNSGTGTVRSAPQVGKQGPRPSHSSAFRTQPENNMTDYTFERPLPASRNKPATISENPDNDGCSCCTIS